MTVNQESPHAATGTQSEAASVSSTESMEEKQKRWKKSTYLCIQFSYGSYVAL